MNARAVAVRITSDPAIQAEIERLLKSHRFTEAECEAVVLLTECFLAGVMEAGSEITHEIALKAGSRAVDRVWCLRRARVPGGSA
jgi:hypothetical protein